MAGSDTSLDPGLAEHLEAILGIRISSAEPVSGGDIARAFRISVGQSSAFLKLTPSKAETMAAELDGLKRLAAVEEVFTPAILGSGIHHETAFLLLDWVEISAPTEAFWSRLAHGLAACHSSTGKRFGLERDNLIGLIPQENAEAVKWSEFFACQRLEPQIKLARDSGHWVERWSEEFPRLLNKVESIVPASPEPSLVHGDLWRGNVLCGSGSRPYLIDPAVYYGHNEVDLALSEMFGGFDRRFYETYAEVRPIEPGYPERRTLYNLYHYLNHLNHFGQTYQRGVAESLARLK